ncbi:MAG TPA: peptidyl-alpha-hydroxyglycine alpha-amidating lyase family protein [Vicinamibacterales bacterium]|nr:peptidyl-alpha-hydroxyglycine alpha-amidating lyase family protein [Vicinamibacterales bacterium]
MRVSFLTGVAVTAAALLASPALTQDVPRNPYTQPSTAYYNVQTWPSDFATPGYVRASNSGIFVESPDRIYLITRGEVKLPNPLPPAFNGTLSSVPQLLRAKPELRNCIIVANARGDVIERWTQQDHLFAMGGRGPHRIKISPYDPERHVWVVDDSGQQIYEFTHDGSRLVMALGEPGIAGNDERHFGRPTDIAWLPDGTFFVADGYANSRIVKFDRNGKYLSSWGTKGSGPGQFNLPHGIDIDQNRRVYVADAHNSRIQVFDENGRFLDQWPNIWRPDVIMVSADQHLWIAAGATDMMLKYDLNGKLLEAWGTPGAGPGEFHDIHGFSVDARGTFYASEAAGGRTQKFTPKRGMDPAKLVGAPQSLMRMDAK